MPGNLSASVHSSYEIELIWTPSIDDGLVIGYDIIRDGVLIKEQLDANSFSDARLEPATTYQYSVIAKDDDNNQSIPSNVEATTFEGPPLAPIINRSNHVELLRHVFDIYTGNAYISDIATLPDWSDPVYAGVPSGYLSLSAIVNIICLNGGTARFKSLISESLMNRAIDFEFADCQDDAVVLNGQLHREYLSGRSTSGGYVTSSGLSINGQSRQLRYSGEVRDEIGYGGPFRNASNVNYNTSDGLSTFELSDATTEALNPPWGGVLISGVFFVRSEMTGNRSMRAEVLEEIEVHLPPYVIGDPLTEPFDRGVLELTGDDGSKLVLNSDNGDPLSVTIEISTSDGASEILIQPWSLWTEDLRFDFVVQDIWIPM